MTGFDVSVIKIHRHFVAAGLASFLTEVQDIAFRHEREVEHDSLFIIIIVLDIADGLVFLPVLQSADGSIAQHADVRVGIYLSGTSESSEVAGYLVEDVNVPGKPFAYIQFS